MFGYAVGGSKIAAKYHVYTEATSLQIIALVFHGEKASSNARLR
jgi:hypothetical protein